MNSSNPIGFFLPQDDRYLHKNLPQFVEDFGQFQSSHDSRSFKRQEEENKLNLKSLTFEKIQFLEKQELIQHIFRMNYRQVDRFFRKDYLRDLSERSEEELKTLILHSLEQEQLLIH